MEQSEDVSRAQHGIHFEFYDDDFVDEAQDRGASAYWQDEAETQGEDGGDAARTRGNAEEVGPSTAGTQRDRGAAAFRDVAHAADAINSATRGNFAGESTGRNRPPAGDRDFDDDFHVRRWFLLQGMGG